MQRIRKSLIWFLAALLVCSLVPAGSLYRASAAAPATYFIPDNLQIRNSALLTLDDASSIITRDNVYLTTNPALTITGTFAYVSESSMRVTIQQLTFQNNVWKPVENRIVSGSVLRESGTTNRFVASNLTLFPGFNMITFSGMQGSVERSDTFYVLYDQVPYIESIVILGGGPGQINLNEGSQAVVSNQNITLQGQVHNATKVTVSLNGGTEVTTSLLDNGQFFSPAFVLRPGLNSFVINVGNNSDSIRVERSVYYFKEDEPFTELWVNVSGESYDAFNTTPIITESATEGTLTAQVLLPYSSTPFEDHATFSIDNGPDVTIVSGDIGDTNIVIPGPDGVTPAYRLVTFTTSQSFTLNNGANDINLTVKYEGFTASKRARFSFLPGRTVIQNMYLLPDFSESSNNDVSEQTKIPLNGAQLESADFYVLVKTDRAPSTALEGRYMPLGTTKLDIQMVTAPVDGLATDGTETVYKITGLLNGQHQIRFYYSEDAPYTVNLSFASKNYIYISNLYDGQVYEFDSRETHELVIEGQYIGFENLSNWQYFVNGVVPDPNEPGNGSQLELDLDPANGDFDFELRLNIRPEGPIVYGENRLLFTGTTYDGTGNKREIRKELRIYVIDTNVSTIARFHPVLVPSNARTPLPAFPLDPGGANDPDIEEIFRITPEFAFSDERYVTGESAYDLVIRGSGASILNLKFGSETFLNLSIPDPPATTPYPVDVNKSFTYNGKTYYYDFSGSQDDFILRVQNIEFEAPGSHVYYLELINGTGARSTQRLEIVRELSSYHLLAPQPTVGNQIIVNKNFVRFDIEAEGATAVLIDGVEATRRSDNEDRFYYDYIGLKVNKWNNIDVEIVRPGGSIKDKVSIYYTGAVEIDSQYMEPLKTKHTVFNKKLELSFPRGTVLMSAMQNSNGVHKYYTDTQLLFGIADPRDGVVERRNDYGHIINTTVSSPIQIPDYLVARFNSTVNTGNFTRISDIYWISGGVGEYLDRGMSGYKAATNGLPPYSLEGNFASGDFEPERKVVPSQRGTLKIAFDENVVEDIAHTVTVFRYTDRGVWENIGGEVDAKKNTITVPFDEFGYYMVVKLSRSYSDIINHPWARNVLNGLYSKGIMDNLRFDEFGADDRTTRGEFVTLLVKGLSLPLNYDNNNTFYDILPGTRTTTWTYEHIETAARAGIVQGRSVGYFGSELPITRQEAAVMIARALELKMAMNDKKLEDSLAGTFQDADRISYYARPAVDAVNKAKIMTGSPVTVPGSKNQQLNFNPEAFLTRAEAGAIAVRMLQSKTKIFPKTLT